jgi:hypothetical protein
VDPVQPARHPRAGLVEVGYWGSREQVADRGGEFVQAGRALGHHPSERPGRHRRPEHVGQQPGGPVDRQVLIDQEVAAERTYPRAVLGRCAHLLGGTAGRLDPAGAAAPLPPMLDDPQAKRGQVEDLANLDPVTGVPASSPPQPPQRSGTWTTISSGSVTCARCAPGVPGCLPGRRPPPSPRAGRVALARPSEDSGLEEFEESFPSRRSSSATRACKVAIRRACSAVAARSSTMTAAWTATVASSSGS